MALPTSGPISFSQIKTELGLTGSQSLAQLVAASNLTDQTAPHSISQFYGYSHTSVTKHIVLRPNGDASQTSLSAVTYFYLLDSNGNVYTLPYDVVINALYSYNGSLISYDYIILAGQSNVQVDMSGQAAGDTTRIEYGGNDANIEFSGPTYYQVTFTSTSSGGGGDGGGGELQTA
jgi:hypothetical protein